MNITCQHCQTKLNIPDEKITPDKDVAFKCPKCQEKILIPAIRKPSSPPAGMAHLPFEERKNALICIKDPLLQKQVHHIVAQMGFNAEIPMDVKDAVSRMEYHVYHLILIDESFDPGKASRPGIFHRLNTMDMSLRRRICFVMVSTAFNSNDNMAALNNSVNNMIHIDDIPRLDAFLSQALMDHKQIYSVYQDSLRQAGKA